MSEDLLKGLRSEIDAVDDEIVAALARRMGIVRRVVEIKREHDIPVYIPERIAKVIDRAAERGVSLGLDGGYVGSLYKLIIDESCRLEDEILGGHGQHG
jgi:chorismate mutase